MIENKQIRFVDDNMIIFCVIIAVAEQILNSISNIISKTMATDKVRNHWLRCSWNKWWTVVLPKTTTTSTDWNWRITNLEQRTPKKNSMTRLIVISSAATTRLCCDYFANCVGRV